MSHLKFDLLENALDSLTQGIDFALDHQDNPRKLKVAILLVSQAVELILKERLQREHWSLILQKVEQARTPNANTVTINEAVNRLRQIANVTLEAQEVKTITKLQQIRNDIQHYKVDLSFEQALAPINAAIAFLIRFLHAELDTDIHELLEESSYQRLLEVEETLEQLRGVAQDRISRLEIEHRPLRPKEQYDWHFEIVQCPKCWEEFYVFSTILHLARCQLCGYEGRLLECSRCGQAFPSGSFELHYEADDYTLCKSCGSHIEQE